jgi:hypothetical protein
MQEFVHDDGETWAPTFCYGRRMVCELAILGKLMGFQDLPGATGKHIFPTLFVFPQPPRSARGRGWCATTSQQPSSPINNPIVSISNAYLVSMADVHNGTASLLPRLSRCFYGRAPLTPSFPCLSSSGYMHTCMHMYAFAYILTIPVCDFTTYHRPADFPILTIDIDIDIPPRLEEQQLGCTLVVSATITQHTLSRSSSIVYMSCMHMQSCLLARLSSPLP